MVTSCARLQLFDLLNCTQWLMFFKTKRIYIFILMSSNMQQAIWYDQMQIYHSCTRERVKNCTGKAKTHGRQKVSAQNWLMAHLREKTLFSHWRLVSFITRSILRDKARWIRGFKWSCSTLRQLRSRKDFLGIALQTWECQALRKCNFTLSGW